MEYTELTPDQQYKVVQQRLLQIEQQHLLAVVNAAAADAADEEEQCAVLTNQATKWAASATAVREILSTMEVPDTPERVRPLRSEPAPRPRL